MVSHPELPPLLILGGQQKKFAHGLAEWQRHERATILRIDPVDDSSRVLLEYQSPPEVCADEEPAFLFRAGTIYEDRLYVPTLTEVLVYSLPDLEQVDYLSLPSFNDVHHVRPLDRDRVLVVSTGLDMVVETSLSGSVRNEWSVIGGDPWERVSRSTDYRKVGSTRPHQSHPNYTFVLDGEVWVTRFEQRDAVCLTKPDRRIDIAVERPHDGCVVGDSVYFTTVNGMVVVANAETLEVSQVHDLNQIVGAGRPLGWCRGLHVLDEDRVLVGFSRLRPTRFHANLAWVRGSWRNFRNLSKLPSRVALFDLRRQELCWEYVVEKAGMNIIFSILPIENGS